MKISFLSNFKQLNVFGFSFFIYFLGVIWLDYSHVNFGFDDFIFISLVYLFLVSDSFLLHLKYYLVNRNTCFELVDDSTICITQNGVPNFISSNDVEILEINLALPVYNGYFPWRVSDSYCYAKVTTKQRSYYITSLLNRELNFPVKFKSKMKKVRRFICWPN